MSTSIAIPARSGKGRASGASSSSGSLANSTSIGSALTPSAESMDGRVKGKMLARDYESGRRRVSLLSSSISKSEHTVVNIGDPDGPPRLITCVKASQGFDWNQDIFLPSYASDHDYSTELERRQDPVEDIFISDEEAEGMFPR